MGIPLSILNNRYNVKFKILSLSPQKIHFMLNRMQILYNMFKINSASVHKT